MIPTWTRFKALFEGASSNDGTDVRFGIELADGTKIRLEMDYEDVGNVMQYLAHLSRDAATKRKSDLLPTDMAPIPVDGIGIALGSTPGTAILVMRLGNLQLGFEAPSDRLAAFASELASNAAMLAREPKGHH